MGGTEPICVNLLLGAGSEIAARLGPDRLLVVGEKEVSSARFDVPLSRGLFQSTLGALDKSFHLPQQSSDDPLLIWLCFPHWFSEQLRVFSSCDFAKFRSRL